MRLLRVTVLWSAIGLTSMLSAQSPASSDVLPFRATETTLANGLKVIVVPTGFPNLVSIQIPVQTGSRNEVEPGKSGFAHFFEHLMFRGTPTNPPERYRQIMTKAGARDNASTGDDATRYYSTFAKEDLETIVSVYADMFQHLSFSEADFKTEARAILGEYNKNSAEPLQKLFEVQRERFYQAHTYKHTTMGFIRDIENMPNEYAYSKVFFERWYRPQYTTVIIAGDVTPERVLPLVEKYWGGWKTSTTVPAAAAIPKEPAPKGPLYVHVPWSSDTLPWVTVAFPGPAFDENGKDSAAVEMLGTLAFGQTSDLYKKLVITEQKVDQLFVDVPASFDPALFTVFARVKNEGDAVYVRDQILATFAKSRQGDARVGAVRVGRGQVEQPLFVCADHRQHRTRRLRALDVHGVQALLPDGQQLLSNARLADGAGPDGDGPEILHRCRPDRDDALEGSAGLRYREGPVARIVPASWLHERRRPGARGARGYAAGSCRSAAGPGARRWKVVLQKSASPLLNVKILFSAGSAHDPAGKEGLAALTAAMVTDAGSTALTTEQIDALLYPIAGSFSARSDKEMTTLTGVIHRDNWQRFLTVVLPQLLSPGWRAEDFQRLKTRQQNALVQDLRSSNEEELGKERLQTNIFRGTPYGHVALGTEAGLRSITLDDVKAFAKQAFTRANLTIGVSGDAPDEMIREIQARLGALPEGPAAPRVKIDGGAAIGYRGRDPRKGHAGDRDLVRLSDRRDARASRLRRAVGRPLLARRASSLERPALPADSRGAGHQLRRLRLYRGVPARDVPVLSRRQRGARDGRSSRSGSGRSCPPTRT